MPEKQTLDRIADRPFVSTFSVTASSATYLGTKIPLVGPTVISITPSKITAEISAERGWLGQSIKALAPEAMGSIGSLFRPVEPGQLVHDEHHGQIITPDEAWTASHVIYVGQSVRPVGDTYRFSVRELEVRGDSRNKPTVLRQIYSRCKFNGNGSFYGRTLRIRSLTASPAGIDDELSAVTSEWFPDESEAESIWNTLSFISGNTVRHLADEYYDDEGQLVKTVHQLGAMADDKRTEYFHYFRGPLASDGFDQLCSGIHRLIKARFPIEVILQHHHESVHRAMDIEAQHLVLALHTAIEAWNKIFGKETFVESKKWTSSAAEILEQIADLCKALDGDLAVNVKTCIKNANRTSMRSRQRKFFEDVRLDVSDHDSTRVLGFRNQLLHNGYFVKRWEELSDAQQQQRVTDIDKLRRIVLLTIFRLTGYSGLYVNPVTFQAEEVESVELPAPLGGGNVAQT